jgi:hypothetical protein
MEVPETRYARTPEGSHLAYQVVGDGPLDLLFLPPAATDVELAWEIPPVARVQSALRCVPWAST